MVISRFEVHLVALDPTIGREIRKAFVAARGNKLS
jgi:hypothetical protein